MLMTSDFSRYEYNVRKYIPRDIFSENIQYIFENNENLFWGRMTKEIRVVRIEKGIYCGKVNCLTNLKIERDILWAILNSNILSYYYKIKNESKHMSGGYFGMDIPSIKELPIINPSDEIKKIIKENVQENNIKELNNIIYKLYGITDEEIEIIERGKNND